MLEVMTPHSKRWKKFYNTLSGKDGCNFTRDSKGEIHWKCDSKDRSRPLATKIMTKMGNIDIPKTLQYFDNHGGYCDCEIMFNVAASSKHDIFYDGKRE